MTKSSNALDGSSLTTADIAKLYGISVRALERARRILARGVPELLALCERGQVKLGPAEIIASMPADEQRAAVQRGPDYIRQLAGRLRRDPVRTCPHCGGVL